MPITPGTDFELELNEKTFNFAFFANLSGIFIN